MVFPPFPLTPGSFIFFCSRLRAALGNLFSDPIADSFLHVLPITDPRSALLSSAVEDSFFSGLILLFPPPGIKDER